MVNLKVALRLDGGSGYEIGMGHVVRGSALAQALADEGCAPYFIARDYPEGVAYLEATGFPVFTMAVDATESDELAHLTRVLQEAPVEALIVDRLHTQKSQMAHLRTLVPRLVTFDDLGDGTAYADLIINGIFWERPLQARDSTPCLFGPDYIIMRPQFASAHDLSRIVGSRIQDILLAFGGSDPPGLTMHVVRALNEMPLWKATVVCGSAFTQKDELDALARQARYPISICHNVTEMASLMMDCDLAIAAAGGMAFELAATGTPTIYLCQYEHQIPTASRFEQKGAALNLGMGINVTASTLCRTLAALDCNPAQRQRMSDSGKAVVDGRGMQRVVKAILEVLAI